MGWQHYVMQPTMYASMSFSPAEGVPAMIGLYPELDIRTGASRTL